jgi:hypothetical protein
MSPEAPARLDRIPSPPSNSAAYPMRAVIPRRVEAKAVDWDLTPDFPLDQGSEGACVGFGCSAELSAKPMQWPTGTPFANRLYDLARAEDRAMGYDFPDGATVLGGLRAAKKLGLVQGYAWARTFEDIRDAVIAHGSVVMGTEWLTGMDSWDEHGVLSVTGSSRGGHCYTIVGYDPADPVRGEVFKIVNSWSNDWGIGGFAWIPADGVRYLFEANGEAAIVTDTEIAPAPAPTPPPEPGAGETCYDRLMRQIREWLQRLRWAYH